MEKGARAGGLAGVALLAGGVAAWFLLSDEQAGLGGDVLAPHASQAATPGELPNPTGPDIAVAGADEPGHLAVAEFPALPDAAAEPGEPLRLTGRVVDESSRAIADAKVHLYPTGRMAKLQGMEINPFGFSTIDMSRLAATTTGPDGTFTIDAWDLPPDEPSSREVRGDVSHDSTGRYPVLIVGHPAFQATASVCAGWKGGDLAAGDIILKEGVTIVGRVMDEDGHPLADVHVSPPPLFDRYESGSSWRTARLLLTTHSGWDGQFRLDGLWTGQMRIQFELAGRVTRVLEREFVAAGVHDLGDVLLPRGGTIAGRVVDARSGAAVADARVLMRPPSSLFQGPDGVAHAFVAKVGTNGQLVDRETRTDARGEFRISGLDPASLGHSAGTLDVFAGATGYEPVRQSGVLPDGEPLTLALHLEASILLTVVDPESGEPIRDATIAGSRHVAETKGWSTKLDLVSDPTTLAALGVPPPHDGVYLLSKAGSHRNTAIISAPGRATRGFVLPAVTAPERASFTAKLPREVGYAGRVVDAEGRPVPGAKVNLHPPDDLRVELPDRDERTGEDGRFRFGGLTHGDWDATVSARGFVTLGPERVPLREKEPLPDAEFVLQPGATLAGVVTHDGVPAGGGEVLAQSKAALDSLRVKRAANQPVPKEERPVVYKTDVAAEGTFRIESLPAGEYVVSGPPGVELVVALAAGETVNVTLPARARPKIRGRVLDAQGVVAGASVGVADVTLPSFLDFDGSALETAGPDGTFEVELDRPATYKVGARQGGAEARAVEAKVDWDEEAWVELRFPGGQWRVVVIAAVSGEPIAGARVALDRLLDDGSIDNTSMESESDARGACEFVRLESGRYRATIAAPGFARARVDSDRIVEGASASELRVPLQAGGDLRGLVRPAGAGALPKDLRMRLSCSTVPGDPLRISLDQSGHFRREGLLPGRWTCEVIAPGGATAPALVAADVEVVAGKTADVELTLPE